MIENVKKKISILIGKNLSFKYNGSRNQTEFFDGIITAYYNHIIVIKSNNLIKSFSYSDILINKLEIIQSNNQKYL